MSPEMRPKSFGPFEKRAPGLLASGPHKKRPVDRSIVSANHWLRSIKAFTLLCQSTLVSTNHSKAFTLLCQSTLVSANHASSNSFQRKKQRLEGYLVTKSPGNIYILVKLSRNKVLYKKKLQIMALIYNRIGNSLPGFSLFLFSFPKKHIFWPIAIRKFFCVPSICM